MKCPESENNVSNNLNPSHYVNQLINEATNIAATSKDVDISRLPQYFDEHRFSEAQRTCNKYYLDLSFASTSGLLILLQIESIAIPLLRSGKSRTVPDLLMRYADTGKHIKNLYESNFYDPQTEGWKSINLVRAMHKRAHTCMNQEEASSNLWVNQYDMALTQFAFAGLLILNPNKCGAFNATPQELSNIAYYWRVIGYYFGIEDRFNLFQLCDDWPEQVKLTESVLSHMKQLLEGNRLIAGTKMAEGFMLSFEDLASELTFNIIDSWWSADFSISGHELTPYTWSDWWKYINFKFIFCFLARDAVIKRAMTYLYKRKFDKFYESREKIGAKLSKKYPDFVCELK